ncbi:MAG: hypothetical protein MUP85_13550 [Candidatus Lokiarchaeota archaeon]|nr:hypothetical protein [Candidatus Lokiarchaeota archaeon]
MDKEQAKEAISLINGIENKQSEIETFLSNLNISSRDEIVKELIIEIIRNNSLFKELDITQEILNDSKSTESNSKKPIIDHLISSVQNNPSKKIVYLRLFLDKFHEISDQDKNVILQSIKNEKNEDLKEKLLSLVSVFKVKL